MFIIRIVEMLVLAFFLVCLLDSRDVTASRILVVAPFFGTSHSIFVHSVMTYMAKSGHDVTIITTNLAKDPPPNYRQIPVDVDSKFKMRDPVEHFALSKMTVFEQIWFPWSISTSLAENVLNTSTVKDFMRNDRSHFDVVIVELFYQEYMFMFAHKYQAPLILLGSSGFQRHIGDVMGNPTPYSYIPNEMFREDADELSLFQRLHNAAAGIFDKIGRKFYVIPKNEKIAKKYFSDVIEGPLPSIEDLENNASLVLLNTHFSYDKVIPLVPGVVEIGGVHIEPAKKLPEDIQKFLDEANEGFIYFGLGSHVESCKMEQEKIDAFLKVFSQLKQKVVWKWENDTPPKLPNLLTGRWLPQRDILAHKNVKLLINHGGMLSTQEAVYEGVPMIGIPIFADQHLNVAKLANRGAAVKLAFKDINEEAISQALDKVLNDPSYKTTMMQLSAQFKDRPMTPLETARYWIEYVIRHKGGPSLKSTARHLAWYKYFMLDIVFIIIFLVCIASYKVKNYCKKPNVVSKKKKN